MNAFVLTIVKHAKHYENAIVKNEKSRFPMI